MSITWSGVDLFFVLSGFLIVGLLFDAQSSPTYFRTFYVSRIFRILPLYYLMLILFWLVPLFEGLDSPWLFALEWPAWTYWTFTQNFYMHEMGFGPQWLSVTWSLAIEEQFYLVIPWLVRWLRPRNLVVLFALGLVTAPVWREFLPSLGGYLLPFARADAICLGGLIAVAYRDEKLCPKISSLGNQLIGGLGLVSAAMIFLIAKNAGIGDVYLHTILALFGGIIILLVLIDEDHLITVEPGRYRSFHGRLLR